MSDTDRDRAENQRRARVGADVEDTSGPHGQEMILRERSIEALWMRDVEGAEGDEPALSETWPATPAAKAQRPAGAPEDEEALPLVNPRPTVAGARFARSRTRAYAVTRPFLTSVPGHDVPKAPEPDTIDLEPRRTPSGRPVAMPVEALADSLYVPESAPPPAMPDDGGAAARPRPRRMLPSRVDYGILAVVLLVAALAAVALVRVLE